jgi:hypothetical protein
MRRRKFYEWMNGPGSQLKEPIQGSTNYLGAYDKYGNLVRARPGWKRPDPNAPKDVLEPGPDMKAEELPKDANAAQTPAGQEDLDVGEAESRDAKKASKEPEVDGSLPPETAEDLRPFPLNRYFRSQAVLSEDLREAIYKRVKRDGATVSLASVEFGVSNERVGAVVRLKQMEKEWIAQVRCLHSLPPLDMMRQLQNSISL